MKKRRYFCTCYNLSFFTFSCSFYFCFINFKKNFNQKIRLQKNQVPNFLNVFFGFNFLIFLVCRLVSGSGIFGFGNFLVFVSFLFFIIFLTIYLNSKK